MCGIAGFCNWEKNWEENIQNMNKRMFHRGPDAGGYWISQTGDVVFGHRRLSIVDLSQNGSQPMESHSGRFVIAYNGEIYNYKEIAAKLKNEGYVREFRSTSDTEVLLEAIEAYGLHKTLQMSKGMFGLAVYDKKDRKLLLARDRVGEKPLHYGFVGKSFVFASDISSIRVLDGFDNAINQEILDCYFIHGYIPAPHTIFKNIYKLMPGTILEISAPYESFNISTYWSMREVASKGQANLFKGTEEEAADELERLLKESIKGQMVADVPVGAFLSAGIDSSAVVALMQSLNETGVRSFTIGMDVKGYNEAEEAKKIAEHLGTQHTELYITEKDMQETIPKLAGIFGEPFADSSQIPTYLVSKLTREHVTVSLSGDAGDELFCGYGSYESIERIWGKMEHIPYFIRKPISNIVLHSPLTKKYMYQVKGNLLGAKNPIDLYEVSNMSEPLTLEVALCNGVKVRDSSLYQKGMEVNHCIMLEDMMMYHPDDILTKVDRSAMAVSLETRVPMLDKDVIEFAWQLPIEYKKKDGIRKKVLKDVLYRYVPKDLMERPKKGFSIPVEKWLKEPELRAWAEALLDRKLIEQQGILNPDVVEYIWKDYIENNQWRIQIWYILMFQEWMVTSKW